MTARFQRRRRRSYCRVRRALEGSAMRRRMAALTVAGAGRTWP